MRHHQLRLIIWFGPQSNWIFHLILRSLIKFRERAQFFNKFPLSSNSSSPNHQTPFYSSTRLSNFLNPQMFSLTPSKLLHLLLLLQLLLLPILANPENNVALENMNTNLEGQGWMTPMEKKRRRRSLWKAAAGGALVGTGAYLAYRGIKGKNG